MKKILLFLIVTNLIFAQDYLIKVNDYSINENDFIKDYENSLKIFGLDNTINNLVEKQLLVEEAKKLKLENDFRIQKKVSEYKNSNIFKILEFEDKKNEILNFVVNNFDKRLAIKLVSVDINSPFLQKDSLEAKNKIIELKKIYDLKNTIDLTNKDVKTQSFEIDHFKVPFIIEKKSFEIKKQNGTSDVFVLDNSYHFTILKEEIKFSNSYILRFFGIEKSEAKAKELIDKVYNDLTKNTLIYDDLIKKYPFSKSTLQNKNESYVSVAKNIPTNVLISLESLKNNEYTKPIDAGSAYVIFQKLDSKLKGDNQEIKKELEKDIYNNTTKDVFSEELIKKANKYFTIKENSNSINEFKILAQNSFKLKDSIKLSVIKNLNSGFFEVNNKSIISLKEIVKNWNTAFKQANIEGFDLYFIFFKNEQLNQAYFNYASNNVFDYNKNVKADYISFLENLLSTYALDYYNQKSVEDVVTQKEYFNLYSSNYIYNKRGKGEIYVCENSEIENLVLKALGNKIELDEVLEKYLNVLSPRNKYFLTKQVGEFDLNNKNLPKGTELKTGIQKIMFNNYNYIVVFDSILEKLTMDFETFSKNLDETYKNYYSTKKLQEIKNKAKIELNKERIQAIKQKY